MRWRYAQTTRAENYVPVDVIVTGYAKASLTPTIDWLWSKYLKSNEAAALTQIINKKKAEIKFQFGRSWFLTSLECGNRSDIRVILWVVVP